MAIRYGQSLPLGALAEALALARRILDAAPDPSRARELALDLVRFLEGQHVEGDDADVG